MTRDQLVHARKTLTSLAASSSATALSIIRMLIQPIGIIMAMNHWRLPQARLNY
jgi:hypothetical protein